MTDLYCDTAAYEPRLTTPAHFILLVNDLPTMTSNLSIGKLYVEYGIRFLYPKIQTTAPSTLWGFSFYSGAGTGVTADEPLGTAISTMSWNSIAPSDLIHQYQDGSGNKSLAVSLPAPGDYVVLTDATKPSTTTSWQSAYSSVPAVSGTITAYVDFSGDTATSEYPGYFTYALGTGSSGSAMTTAVPIAFHSIGFYHAVRTGAKIWMRGASDCSGKTCRFTVMRMPSAASLGSDMYIQYTKLVGTMRAFSQTFAHELQDMGVPRLEPESLAPSDWKSSDDVRTDQAKWELLGAAASGVDTPPLTQRQPTLSRLVKRT
jgi:hypothetical protein